MKEQTPYPPCNRDWIEPEYWAAETEHDPNFWQLNWLDRVRERIAIVLAPWACHDDLVEWYKRGRP